MVMLEALKRKELLEAGRIFSSECVAEGYSSLNKVRRNLKANLRRIRDSYKNASLGALPESDNYIPREWLCDNYYLIDREGKAALSSLEASEKLPSESDGYPVMYKAAVKLCGIVFEVGKEEFEAFLEGMSEGYSFSNSELYVFKTLLAAAAIGVIADVCALIHTKEGGDTRKISGGITTLRGLSGLDFSESFEKLSECENLLKKDPSGDYSDMSEETKEYYRRCISVRAKKEGISEKEFVGAALKKAREASDKRQKHIGAHIIQQEKHVLGGSFVLLSFLFPVIASILTAFLTDSIFLGIYLFFPFAAILKVILEGVISPFLKQKFVCSMEPEKLTGKTETVVVISCLITSAEQIKKLIKNLLRVHLSGKGIRCGLLADFQESDTPTRPEDVHILAVLEKEIRRLNRDNAGGFFAVVRKRTFIPSEGKYMGLERKRGAITEFVRYIKDGVSAGFALMTGELKDVTGAKYLLTLDADTEVSINAVAEMTAVLEHPLNKVEIKNGKVTNGFGIAVPRLTTDIDSSSKSFFSRVFAGSAGLHSYGGSGGDFFQDIFGEGLFTGKGLIDVNAYYTLVDGAFPLNKILSHDILESGVMKACVLPDTELSDSFPTTVKSWLIRLARWIRGDFQNGIFIKKLILNEKGSRVRNNLGIFDKYKIYENIRRALTPVYILSVLIAFLLFDFKQEVFFITLLMLAVSPGDVWGGIKGVLRPAKAFRRFISRAVPAFLAGCARILFNILMLPQVAFIGLSEGLKALWRSCFSHKNMLEWMTAAEAESGRKNGVTDYYSFMWFNVVVGVAFLFLGSLFFKVLGVLWMVAPAFFCEISRPAGREKYILKEEDEELLYSSASAIWRFFEKYVSEETNFLPPDNIQYSPYRVAMRTSPTNIGLYLLCALCARDFGFIDSNELAQRIFQTLKTIEGMKKWKGNLYNWYDITTLETLHPEYVSSVDSGNLLCCMTALKEGIKEYIWETPELNEAVVMCEKLLSEADISALYNKKRKLFYIGYDAEKEDYGNNMYDILMSEARMTSYYAISKKVADKKHWGMMGRLFAGMDGYVGPVSWTGTMFEYYMPHLLLPVTENSLSDEALKYALYCQKKRVAARKLPWGVSESGFYAFDSAQNYQYKAFGVQKLGLKRGLNEELVISPYSTYLVLPFAPDEAIANLKSLMNLGLNGEFGLYEGMDFTPSRVGGGFGIVKSYMAHHLGMSLVSIANMIFDGVMQKRFMRDMDMSSGQKLLEEAIYDNVSLYKGVALPDAKVKVRKIPEIDTVYTDVAPGYPRANLLSNGEFSTVVTDGGCGFSLWNGINVNKHQRDTRLNPMGIFALLKEEDKTGFSITAAPMYDGVIRRSEFSASSVSFTAVKDGLEAAMGISVHGRIPAEVRGIKVGNTDKRKKDCELLIYTEPVLRKESEYQAHPAFSDIFVICEYMSNEKCLLVSRKGNNGEEVCVAYGFSDRSIDFEFETDRSNVLDKGKGVFFLKNAFEKEFSNRDGTPVIPCVAIKTSFPLKSGENKSFVFIQSVGKNGEEALARFLLVRRQSLQSIMKTAQETAGSMVVAASLGLSETRLLGSIIPRIFFDCPRSKEVVSASRMNSLGRSGLWSLSISGDKPIVTYDMVDENCFENAVAHISSHRIAELKGAHYDLCILYREGGAYDSRIKRKLTEAISQKGNSESVFIVDVNTEGEEKINLLKACSVYLHLGEKTEEIEREDKQNFTVYDVLADTDTENIESYVPGGGFEKESFVTYPQKSKSTLPWCFPMANKCFGTLVSDSSLGFSFYLNSYLNQLTPWNNDYMADNCGEKIFMRLNEKYYDLTSGAFVRFSPGIAEYRSNVSNLKITVKVSVDEKFPKKRIKVFIHNDSDEKSELSLAYVVFPFPSQMPQSLLKTHLFEGMITAENPANEEYPDIRIALSATGKPLFLTSREAVFAGDWENPKQKDDGKCVAVIKKHIIPAGKDAKEEFCLSVVTKKSVFPPSKAASCENSSDQASGSKPAFEIDTPDEELNRLVNFFLPYQCEISRVYSRTGFSQNSGAFGFRDQLQDVCSLIYSNPSLVKSHILKAASVQFEEGDVLHWWHKLPKAQGGFKGVRTKCSDDLLWLPYAVAFYVKTTGDSELLKMSVNFISGDKLSAGESEKYITPSLHPPASVYEHCKRALDFAYKTGRHGLLLIGSGDWNDGMNRVGIKGRGESVWLSMFAICVMREFSDICEQIGDTEYANVLRKRCAQQRSAVESNAWEDDRYIRGYHDDGSKLGSASCEEAKIDSLPQSFSVFCGCKRDRSEIALESCVKKLVMKEKNIVRLFDPPYHSTPKDIGYIKAYPKGIRENGGQYTHAAVWLAKALLDSGKSDEGYSILNMISPITHSFDSAYKIEPYFLAADIYTSASCIGRGGWSIYTGAAGWYYRVVIEDLLGIRLIGDKLYVNPSVPGDWDEFRFNALLNGTQLRVRAERTGRRRISVNNEASSEYVTLDGKDKDVKIEF